MHSTLVHKQWRLTPCADPEGGRWSGAPPPLTIHKNIGLLAILVRIPYKSQSYQSWTHYGKIFWTRACTQNSLYIHVLFDHTLQMYRLISPHCLCNRPWGANSGDSLRSAYIFMCCLIVLSLSNSILGQAAKILTRLKCTCLVSVLCSRHLYVKQPKFEIYFILCRYSYHSFL